MYKIGGRKNANTHYKLSYKWASWFWRKYCSLVLPSGLEINVCLLLGRACSLDWVGSWESFTLLMTGGWDGVMLTLAALDRRTADSSTLHSLVCSLQLNCAYHICCNTAFWPSNFKSPLHCHTLNSCLRWHDTFYIPFSFFCLFPLLL